MPNIYDFIESHKEQWDRFKELLDTLENGELSSEEIIELERLYRKLNADFAFAQNRYPNSEYTRLLESLIIRAHSLIYPKHEGVSKRTKEFFSKTIPRSFIRNRNYVYLSLAVMVIGFAMGFALSLIREDLGERLLGESIVSDLKAGYLWTEQVNKQGPMALFGLIYGNNVSIAMRSFASGVIFGIGAFLVLLYNGFFLGAVFGTTLNYGMAARLLEFIAAHGPIELFAIVIASAAGMRIGFALLAPGRLNRIDALSKAGTEALPLLIFSMTLLILAALIEAFVSPYYSTPFYLKLSIGLLLLSISLAYVASGIREEAKPR